MDQLATHNKIFENQIAQQAGSLSKTVGKLRSQPEMKPKEHCKAVTLRSGRILEQPKEKPTKETFEKYESQAERKRKKSIRIRKRKQGRKKSYQSHISLPYHFLRDSRKPNWTSSLGSF